MEVLSTEEARVLGCMIEKEATTPDAYPLTMNALVLACNQTSNRTPVVRYSETIVNDALLQLRERKLTRLVHSSHGSRVSKHRHALSEVWAITQAELAVLAVLLLRGPQTVNELRTRTERYGADIDDLGGVQGVLDRLAARDEPLAACLGRQPGQREERWAQLLAEEPARAPEVPDAVAAQPWQGAPARSWPAPAERPERPDRLADEVRSLRRDVDELRREVDRLLGRD
jgi:uncharacterized protein